MEARKRSENKERETHDENVDELPHGKENYGPDKKLLPHGCADTYPIDDVHILKESMLIRNIPRSNNKPA